MCLNFGGSNQIQLYSYKHPNIPAPSNSKTEVTLTTNTFDQQKKKNLPEFAEFTLLAVAALETLVKPLLDLGGAKGCVLLDPAVAVLDWSEAV
jgi:hypothetical protein